MVVKGSSKAETDRWHQALMSHVNHYTAGRQAQTYIQPRAREPKLLKDVIILDLGSSSVRAGILGAHGTITTCYNLLTKDFVIKFMTFRFAASLPQVFFPSVAAVDKGSGLLVAFGTQATLPEIRANSSLAYPLRPSNKISKVNFFGKQRGIHFLD